MDRIQTGGTSFNDHAQQIGDIINGSKTVYNINTPPPPEIDPVKATELFQRLPTDHVPDYAPLPSGSRMDLDKNSQFFVGRQNELIQLAKNFQSSRSTVVVATTGMGGIGKTQLASEFVHRYGCYFAGGVYWLSFAEAEGIETEIVACGKAMGLAGFADLKFPDQVELVKQQWKEPIPRLLVFDNCEDEALLNKYKPEGSGSHVLVTSRRQGQAWSSKHNLYELRLETLPRHESIALLRRFRPDLAADDPDLERLAEALGDLPLALHVAGSYLERYQASVSPAKYLEKLQSAPLQKFALRFDGTTPTKHERCVMLTLKISYDQLDATKPIDALALAVLAHAAHFAPGEPIDKSLVMLALSSLLPAEEPEDTFTDALIRLDEIGLIERNQQTMRLHRLIAEFILHINNDLSAQQAVVACFLAIADNAGPQYDQYLALRDHLVHLRYVANKTHTQQKIYAAHLQQILGDCLYYNYDKEGALTHYQQAQHLYQTLKDNLGLANSLHAIGDVLVRRNNNVEALNYYKQAEHFYRMSDDKVNKLGLANTLKSIGEVCMIPNDDNEAFRNYKQAKHLYQEIGDELGLANVQFAMGNMFMRRNDDDKALRYYKQAQKGYQAINTKFSFAHILAAQGQIALIQNNQELADSLLQEAIKIYKSLHDDYHIAMSIGNYGWALYHRGRYVDAKKYLLKAADLFRRIGMHDDAERCCSAVDEIQKITNIFTEAQKFVQIALGDSNIDRQELAQKLEHLAKHCEMKESHPLLYKLAPQLRDLIAQLDLENYVLQQTNTLITQYQAAFADACTNLNIERVELKQNIEALARWAARNNDTVLSTELSALAAQLRNA
jgi:tetratricopeptide (TPR) repeat protein